MPFALIFIGLLLLISGVRGSQKELFDLVRGDFTGQSNFIYWVVAILGVGAVGYIKPIKPVSDAFIVLIIIVMFLSNKGFFSQFMGQIGSTTNSNAANSMFGVNGSPINLGSGSDLSKYTGLNTNGLTGVFQQ